MMPDSLIELALKNIAKLEDEVVILQFDGFVSSKRCVLFLTEHRLIRIHKRPGLPVVRRIPINEIKVKKSSGNGEYARVSLIHAGKQFSISGAEIHVKLLSKKLGAQRESSLKAFKM